MKNGSIPPNSTFSFTATAHDAGKRLDKYINDQFSHYSRSFLQKLIEQKQVTVNNHIIVKPSMLVKEGDHITIHFPELPVPEPQTVIAQTSNVEILFEHEHFLIIYKPAGILAHAPSKYKASVSLVDWIHLHHQDIKAVGAIDRPGIVHRLDKDTSGLMIIPRTNYAYIAFEKMFKDHLIKKTYLALVQGTMPAQGTIDFSIGRHPIIKTRMATGISSTHANFHTMIREQKKSFPLNPRNAVTHYKSLEYFDNATLIEAKPITGRTHQIRVHCAALGHPILGDQVYGKKSSLIARQALHAHKLSFTFDGKEYTFTQDVPSDFQDALNHLRKKS